MNYIELQDVVKTYQVGEVQYKALDHASFALRRGELVIIVGPSGAGKTTMLNILGGIDRCDEGKVIINGTDISHFSPKQLTKFRRESIGFVFQHYNLIQNLTALENVRMASDISAKPYKASQVLEMVGLKDRSKNFPSQLSGGEQQRVAIARALVKRPALLLCDEPTGALDYATGKSVLSLLQSICYRRKMTVILITHNQALTPIADRVVYMKNGGIEKICLNPRPLPVEVIEW